VTDVTDRAYDTDLLDAMSKRVLVGDGAMGTQLRNEILNDTRPDVIETIHRNCFEAGADAVETKYVRLQSG
jgi:5-methyltetrahydrofolate--homocysteine methyltransferase